MPKKTRKSVDGNPAKKPTGFILIGGLLALATIAGTYLYRQRNSGNQSPVSTVIGSTNVQVHQGPEIHVSTNIGFIAAHDITFVGTTNAASKSDLDNAVEKLSKMFTSNYSESSELEFERKYPLGFVVYGMTKYRVGGIPYSTKLMPENIEFDWSSARLEPRDDGRLTLYIPNYTIKHLGRINNTQFISMSTGITPGKRTTNTYLESASFKIMVEVLDSTSDSAVAVVGFKN